MRPLNAAIRVGLFAVGLVAVFGGAFAMGAVFDPDAGDGGDTHGRSAAAHADRSHVSSGPARLVVEDRSFDPGIRGTLAFRVVDRDGEPVDDIEPYLGARGHLVALRAGDLAFQHVHPKDAATEGREINFDVALEGAGDHRLFLQFKHDGEVRTAAFTERGTDRGAARGEEDDHGH